MQAIAKGCQLNMLCPGAGTGMQPLDSKRLVAGPYLERTIWVIHRSSIRALPRRVFVHHERRAWVDLVQQP